LTVLAKEGGTRYHFADYAPPAFMMFRDQIALQMTLRNSIQFGLVKGSTYKRAAQSFNLFLAPQAAPSFSIPYKPQLFDARIRSSAMQREPLDALQSARF
jgi:hypothetical protein